MSDRDQRRAESRRRKDGELAKTNNIVLDPPGPDLPKMPGHDWKHPRFATCPSCRGEA